MTVSVTRDSVDNDESVDARTEGESEATPARRVLVVDDAPTVRFYHGSILRSVGFEVCEAGNGFEALEMVLSSSFELLVVDVNMPLMDGLELVRRLRSIEVGCVAPVVMISTEAGEADLAAAYRCGANLFLVKPVAPQLLQRVAEVLTLELPAAWVRPVLAGAGSTLAAPGSVGLPAVTGGAA